MYFKKLLTVIVSLLLITSCSNEYFDFHSSKENLEKDSGNLSKNLETFSLEKVEEKQLDFYTTPDKEFLNKLV